MVRKKSEPQHVSVRSSRLPPIPSRNPVAPTVVPSVAPQPAAPSTPSVLSTAYPRARPVRNTSARWIPRAGGIGWILDSHPGGPSLWFGGRFGPRRSLRRRLSWDGDWIWVCEPFGPDLALVPEDWTIPHRRGPPAIEDEESEVDVEDFGVVIDVEPQKRAMNALIAAVFHIMWIIVYHRSVLQATTTSPRCCSRRRDRLPHRGIG